MKTEFDFVGKGSFRVDTDHRLLIFDNNALIYSKDLDGFERWFGYDARNNCTHFKNSREFEVWREFNNDDDLMHYEDSSGIEEWYNCSGLSITKEAYYAIHGK